MYHKLNGIVNTYLLDLIKKGDFTSAICNKIIDNVSVEYKDYSRSFFEQNLRNLLTDFIDLQTDRKLKIKVDYNKLNYIDDKNVKRGVVEFDFAKTDLSYDDYAVLDKNIEELRKSNKFEQNIICKKVFKTYVPKDIFHHHLLNISKIDINNFILSKQAEGLYYENEKIAFEITLGSLLPDYNRKIDGYFNGHDRRIKNWLIVDNDKIQFKHSHKISTFRKIHLETTTFEVVFNPIKVNTLKIERERIF